MKILAQIYVLINSKTNVSNKKRSEKPRIDAGYSVVFTKRPPDRNFDFSYAKNVVSLHIHPFFFSFFNIFSMKRTIALCFFVVFLFFGLSMSSCSSNKTGCPINENAHVKSDKKGNFSKRRGKSNLFPKQMRRKKKKKG